MFDAALAAKTQNLESGRLTHAVYDVLIFNKLKKALGMDCLRLMISGSAPLSDDVLTFFRCMLGVPVFEGALYMSLVVIFSNDDDRCQDTVKRKELE